MARRYQVKDMARLSGVSVRTLHHYDRIGLLTPRGRTAKGYRLYGDEELVRLQQILVYRALGMPLDEIARVVESQGPDVRTALKKQRELVQERLDQTQAMLRSIDRALAQFDGNEEIDMSEIFEGFEPGDYEEEVEARWGNDDAFAESKRRTSRYDEASWRQIKQELNTLLERFAQQLSAGAGHGDEAVRGLVEEHRLHIDRWFYPCSPSMHASLAEMYVADERFRATFDEHAEGLAEFVATAIGLAHKTS